MLTPGHSPGARSVVIETAKGAAMITGFCCKHANFNPTENGSSPGFTYRNNCGLAAFYLRERLLAI